MTFDERVKRLEECEEDENHIQRKKDSLCHAFRG